MAGKDHTKSVHMTKHEEKQMEDLAAMSGRSVSSLIHDAITCMYLDPSSRDERLIKARVAHVNSMRSCSVDSLLSEFSDRSASEEGARFSRINSGQSHYLH